MKDSRENTEPAAIRRLLRFRLSEKRHLIALLIFGLGLALAGVYAINWWITAMNTVYTDEARVTASYATIGAEVSGKIVKFFAEEGDVVRQGDLLVEIDKEEYKSALDEAVVELKRVTAQYEEGKLQFKGMAATVSSEISSAEAALEAAGGKLKEKTRMFELAKQVGKSQVEQSEAAVKVAESNLARADADLKKAALDLERANALFGKHLIAAKDLDDAKTAYETAQATVEMRKSEVRQLRADLQLAQISKLNNFRDDAPLAEVRAMTAKSDVRKADADLRLARARLAEVEAFKARLEAQESMINRLKVRVDTQKRNLESTSVTSPVNGIVVRRTANIGDIMQRGQPFLKIIIRDTLEVRANVRETYVRHIGQGNPVEIYVDAYPNRVFAGKVKLIGDTTDSEFALFKPGGPYSRLEQMIPVEISLDGDSNNRDLKPGMNAWVYIKRTSALQENARRQAHSQGSRP
ncbi:MAG TPA: HlyD family secretion protein [Candidatus Binatia bacterium]|jgi:membrane fusion protein (multidrug efflux system)